MMRAWIAQHWLFLGGGAALAAFGAWLVFGLFAVHLVFVDDVVDEDLPDFFSESIGSETAGNDAGASVESSGSTDPDGQATLEAEDNGSDVTSDSEVDVNAEVGTAVSVTTTTAAAVTTTTAAAATTTTVTQPIIEASGQFVDRSHPTSGKAIVLSNGGGRRFLRFEDFETDNGPDLDVYLSAAAPDAPAIDFDEDFVNLGDLKGNKGNQNYEIPIEVDLDHHSTVVIWCVRFAVAFGAADLVAT